MDCVKKTYKAGGVKGCYKGVTSGMGGVFVFRGLWFGFYDFLKRYIITDHEKSNRVLRFSIATVVTVVSGYICYPFDTVSRRLMI